MSNFDIAMRAACIQAAAIFLQRGGQIAPAEYERFAKLSFDLFEAWQREFNDRVKRPGRS